MCHTSSASRELIRHALINATLIGRRAPTANGLAAETSAVLNAKVLVAVVDVLLGAGGDVFEVLAFVFFGHGWGGMVVLIFVVVCVR